MRLCTWILVSASVGLWLASPAGGQTFPALPSSPLGPAGLGPPTGKPEDRFSARLVVSHATVAPGETFHAAVVMTIAKGSWTYGPVPGGKIAVLPTEVRVQAGPLRAGKALYGPTGRHTIEGPDGPDTYNVYEGTGYIYVPLTVPDDARPGRVEITATVEPQVCDPNTCIPMSVPVRAAVEVGHRSAPSPEWTGPVRDTLARSKTTEQWKAEPAAPAGRRPVRVYGGSWIEGLGLAAGLAVALLAGLVFNIMPCVLPVLPLRLLALLNQAGQSRRRFLVLGLAFAGGIVLFFAGIAAVSLVLKLTAGRDVTLNDVFLHRPLLYGLVLVLVALAMNLFGAFTVTVPGRVAQAEGGSGPLGAVSMGAIFAVLSVPCSGAIIAGQFFWAQLQPPWAGALSLLLMGFGMAAPHVAIAFFPQVVSRIPRAGRWSELMKQFVGFVILLVVAFLLGVQGGDARLTRAMVYAVVLAMCLWVWGTWVTLATPPLRRWIVRGSAAALAVAAGWWLLRPPAPPLVKMEPFDAAAIQRARAEGKVVLVKFTASWCGECWAIERRIYRDPEVAERLKRPGIVAVKGDVSSREHPAWKMLRGTLGELGPPLTAIFPPGGGEPIRLRGSFSKGDLFRALAEARGG